MSDPTPALHLPEYRKPPPNPKGIPLTDSQQSKLLMRAVKVFGKVNLPKKKGLISKDQIAIKHKRPKFY